MAETAVSLATRQAERLVDKLVDKLYSTVSGELSLLLGVRGEIQYIKDELEVMSAFLRRAEEKQNSDPAAKAWVKQVKELAYAVEDCIAEFVLHLPRGNTKNLAHALWRRARSLGSLRARRRIALDIQSIKSRVEEVSKRRLRYGIDDKASTTSDEDVDVQFDPRSAALFVEDSQLVGIDRPREKLVNWLLDGQPSLSLMAVVGAGGLGKTTVIKRAVESPKVTGGHFDCRAWVTVSQVYRVEGLLRDMIKQTFSSPPENLEKMDKTELSQGLKDHLKGKRYAIVFDDIWKVDAWKSLEVALPRNTNGSKVIITTRIDDVAGACRGSIPLGDRHVQGKLSEDESWELFCKKVFPEQTCPEELETLSRSILEKCDGLPLAIVAISAALASKPKKTSEEWKDMLAHLGSQLESNPSLQGVKQVLNFSYIDLPYHVKQCFLYLSKFTEHSLIKCNRIKRLWIAEGLVSGHGNMTAEDVATSYLNVLISRRLILPSKFTTTGKLKSFTIHDIMMEMVVSKSMEENFVHVLKKDSKWLPRGVIRRLSTHTEHVPEDFNLSFVRSMTIFGNGTPSFLSESPAFKLLRVLDFDGCTSLCDKHLKVICGLLHLKYLSLRNTGVSMLPDSIGNLRNLETLDFRDCYDFIGKIPPKILNLQRLSYLRGHRFVIPTKRIGSLRSLNVLGDLRLETGMVKELLNLNQLTMVKLSGEFQGRDGTDFCDFLKTTSNSLTSLKIYSFCGLTFLDDPSMPPLVLQKLTLKGSLDKLPSWVSSLDKLVKISLRYTKLGVDAVGPLGAIPNLVSLVLEYEALCEERIIFDAGGFASLKVLRLSSSSVVFGNRALPRVEMVCLTGNRGMFMTEVVGTEHLSGLKTIVLKDVGTQVEDMVKEAVKAHPNHPKLIIKREREQFLPEPNRSQSAD